MLLKPKHPCPKCKAIVPNRHPVGKPYRCINCRSELQLSRSQLKIEFWIDLAIAAMIAWLLGARHWSFVVATIIISVPVGLLSVPLWEKLWPMRLEPWDGKRVI